MTFYVGQLFGITTQSRGIIDFIRITSVNPFMFVMTDTGAAISYYVSDDNFQKQFISARIKDGEIIELN